MVYGNPGQNLQKKSHTSPSCYALWRPGRGFHPCDLFSERQSRSTSKKGLCYLLYSMGHCKDRAIPALVKYSLDTLQLLNIFFKKNILLCNPHRVAASV